MAQARSYYLRVITNPHGISSDPELASLKQKIIDLLAADGPLRQALFALPNDKKELLIAALVANAQDSIAEVLLDLIKTEEPEVSEELVKRLAEHTALERSQQVEYLSLPARQIISAVLGNDVKEVNPVTRLTILQNAMEMIPDQRLQSAIKKSALASMRSGDNLEIIRFSSGSGKKLPGQLDYLSSVTNRNFVVNNKAQVMSFKMSMIREMSDAKSALREDLYQLPDEAKSALIAAMFRNDSSEIIRLLGPVVKKLFPQVTDEAIGKIATFVDSREIIENQYASPAVYAIVTGLIEPKNAVFNPIYANYLVQRAVEQIPDNELSVYVKKQIVVGYDKAIAKSLESFTYIPTAESKERKSVEQKTVVKAESKTTDSKGVAAKDKAVREYRAIIKNKKLDISDYILVTLDMFEKVCKESKVDIDAEIDLKRIMISYHQVDYLSTLELIREFVGEYAHIFGDDLANLIIDKSGESEKIKPKMNENFSRRFYENRVVEYEKEKIDVGRFNKVSHALIGMVAQARDDLDRLPLLSIHLRESRFFARMEELRLLSPRFLTRDRHRVEKTLASHEESEGKVGEVIYSRNTGVMTSNQPNYPTEISSIDLRNRVVDRSRGMGRADPDDKSHFAAYAASTSGHAIYLVALLEDYMEKNPGGVGLEQDINNYVKAFALSYASRGYHSYLEISEVFQEKGIKALFNKYNVTINIEPDFESFSKAMIDAREYASTTTLKKAALSELKLATSSGGILRSIQSPLHDEKKEVKREMEHHAPVERKEREGKTQEVSIMTKFSALAEVLSLAVKLQEVFKGKKNRLTVCGEFNQQCVGSRSKEDILTHFDALKDKMIALDKARTDLKIVKFFKTDRSKLPSTIALMMIERSRDKIENGLDAKNSIRENVLDFMENLNKTYAARGHSTGMLEVYKAFEQQIGIPDNPVFNDAASAERMLKKLYERTMSADHTVVLKNEIDGKWGEIYEKLGVKEAIHFRKAGM